MRQIQVERTITLGVPAKKLFDFLGKTGVIKVRPPYFGTAEDVGEVVSRSPHQVRTNGDSEVVITFFNETNGVEMGSGVVLFHLNPVDQLSTKITLRLSAKGRHVKRWAYSMAVAYLDCLYSFKEGYDAGKTEEV